VLYVSYFPRVVSLHNRKAPSQIGPVSLSGGLSANDIEADFLAAGADAFMIKPFPGKPDELRQAMRKLLTNYDPPFQKSIAV
jgi:DNA-binding response OmpR family regulator